MGEDALNQPWLLDAGDHPERAGSSFTENFEKRYSLDPDLETVY